MLYRCYRVVPLLHPLAGHGRTQQAASGQLFTKKTMKGNDGKAARRKTMRRLLTLLSIAGSLAVLLLVGVKTIGGSTDDKSGGTHHDPTSRAAQVLHNLHEHGSHHTASNVNQALRRRASQGAQNVQNWMQRQHHRPQGGDDVRGPYPRADDDERGEGEPVDDVVDEQEQQGGGIADEAMQDILAGKLHIMDIRPTQRQRRGRGRGGGRGGRGGGRGGPGGGGGVEFDMHGGYSGLTASFCPLDWSLQKEDPTQVSMFHDLVDKSEHCWDRMVEYDLYAVVQAARENDANQNHPHAAKIALLNLTGVVFHESRCGSTLVANALAAMNPAAHRVYSESTPPISIMRLAEDDGSGLMSVDEAAHILKDVIYLMSRSSDDTEQEQDVGRVFFKFQSISTRSISVFQRAFPTVPWIFVYRDPVQVLMSHLGVGRMRDANCVRPQQGRPAAAVERLVEKYGDAENDERGGGGARGLIPQDFCAAHLASLTESAVEHMNEYGTPVNYVDLPHILYDDILPNRWGVPTTEVEIHRIQQVSTQYSKQGRQQVTGKEFKSDSEHKEKMASPEVRAAAQRYLQPSFEALQRMAEEKKNHRFQAQQ